MTYNFQEVKDEEAIKYADSIGAIFQTISAKSNTGIDKLFNNIGRKFFDPNFDYKKQEENEKQIYNIKKENKNKIKKEAHLDDNTSIDSVKLYNEFNKKREKKRCC